MLPHTANSSIFPEPHSPFLTRVAKSVSLFYAHFPAHWHSCLLFTSASHTSLHPGIPFPFLYPNYCDCSVFHPLPGLANLIGYLCLHHVSPLARTWGQPGAADGGQRRANGRGPRSSPALVALRTCQGNRLPTAAGPVQPVLYKQLRPCCFIGSPRLSTAHLSLPVLEMEISHTGFNSLLILTAALQLRKVQALT